LNLRRAFENQRDRLCPAFKTDELAGKLAGELALAGFQSQQVVSCRLSKALGAAPRNLLPNRSKGFELAGFKMFFANSKAFRAKRLRIK
jgi:hypothetical protein